MSCGAPCHLYQSCIWNLLSLCSHGALHPHQNNSCCPDKTYLTPSCQSLLQLVLTVIMNTRFPYILHHAGFQSCGHLFSKIQPSPSGGARTLWRLIVSHQTQDSGVANAKCVYGISIYIYIHIHITSNLQYPLVN